MGRRRRLFALAVASALVAAPVAGWATFGPRPASVRTPATAAPSPSAADLLEQQLGGTTGPAPILAFVHGAGADIGVAEAAVDGAGLRLVDRFERVGVAVALGTPDQLRAASVLPGVTRVELDQPLRFFLDTSHVATRGEDALQGFTGTTTTAGTKKNGKKSKPTTTTAAAPPLDGTGVGIAIVDSGIDGTHPFFLDAEGNSKVVRNLKFACMAGALVALEEAGVCTGPEGDAIDEAFVDVTAVNDTDTISGGGHGTHVAGIAGGGYATLTDGPTMHGAAPGAKLVGLSVGATVSVYGGFAGLNWVLEHHAEPCDRPADAACPAIRVVNNSWGYGGEHDPESLGSKLQNALVAEGVTVVWAAGNDGGDGSENMTNPPGQSPTPGVISVANYDDANRGARDNILAESSSRGEAGRMETYPDVAAPGTNITSACRPYLPICSTGLDGGDPDYDTIGGTSMAAPHVAGIVAQLLQVDPTLTPAEVEDVLEDTAYKFPAGGAYEADLSDRNPDDTTSFDKGHGLVDVKAAVASLLGITIEDAGAPAPTSPCAGDVVAVDVADDATEPTVDVVGATATVPEAGTVTFSIDAPQLAEAFPATYNGYSFYVDFLLEGRKFYVSASRDTFDGETFAFGRPDPSAENVRSDLTATGMSGTFTFGEGLTITLTQAAIDAANTELAGDVPPSAPIAALGDGFAFQGVAVVSYLQRNAVVVASLPAGDTASSGCTYTVGSGSAPTPAPGGGGTTPPPSTEPADATLSSPGASDEWEGGPFTDVNQFGVFATCAAPDYEFCDVRRIDLQSTTGPFTVRITSAAGLPVITDFDVTVYGPDGRKVGSSGELGTDETVVVQNPKPGLYTIVVSVASAVEDTYQGVATAG